MPLDRNLWRYAERLQAGLDTDNYQSIELPAADWEEVELDTEDDDLAVTLDSIEFEGIELGRFQIRLRPPSTHSPARYRVVALEPNPAVANEDVTHPHVSGETLCEGDGRAAIAQALASGRIGDFFLLVSRLLKTYAPGRAYVELSEWHGVPCHDCGNTTDEDDRSSCQRCDEVLCSDCTNSCTDCGYGYCFNCIESCRLCSEAHCGSCLEVCRSCGTNVCSQCRTEKECHHCHEAHEMEATPQEAPGDELAIQPDSLGQTVISA